MSETAGGGVGAPAPLLPDYGGGCLDGVVPAILGRHRGPVPPWLPEPVVEAEQVVLLVLDGMGWEQLQERTHLAPTLAAMTGGPITTVAPSTTATALTSLTTGAPPAVHGVVGYRMRTAAGEVLNALRWTTPTGDARVDIPPESVQGLEAFGGTKPPAVTKAEFADSGFSRAHLAGVQHVGWRYPSTLVVRVADLVAEGHPFVYAYYPGVDTVAHELGFGRAYDAEVAAADRLVADVLGALPPGTALVVVADHGQVEVGERVVYLDPEITGLTTLLSGEARFRWLHARPGMVDRLADVAERRYGHQAWVRTREQVVAEGWLGGRPSPEVASRLGDVAIVARAPVAFSDPADTGPLRLRCRHGSLTPAEMLVPLVAARA
ncbi:MAG: alkaline phosphatase family protein [Actinobacteria bacterium]|nr:alkaline phosphatase family protein [Actinomycetota bacterium]